jgi:hypothetical protein
MGGGTTTQILLFKKFKKTNVSSEGQKRMIFCKIRGTLHFPDWAQPTGKKILCFDVDEHPD